jgi:hypothetical protein
LGIFVNLSAKQDETAGETAISAKAKQKPGQKGAGRPGERSREAAVKGHPFQIPFTRKNYIAFAVGLALLIVGYICLAQPPANGFLSLTLAPILLVLGYCVVFPYAIMARQRSKPKVATATPKGD